MKTQMMLRRAIQLGCASLVVLLAGGAAQGQAQQAATPPKHPPVGLKVDVVLTRYQGDKKVSSLPFTIAPTADSDRRGNVSLRVGVDVPMGMQTTTTGSASAPQGASTTTSQNYRNVGTSIDCNYAMATDDGRFRIMLSIQDSSIVSNGPSDSSSLVKSGEPPAFRSFQTSNELTLRDGQSMQFVMATDKITGEVLKVDVTLTVIK